MTETNWIFAQTPGDIAAIKHRADELGAICDVFTDPEEAAKQAKINAMNSPVFQEGAIEGHVDRILKSGGAVLRLTTADRNAWLNVSNYYLDLRRAEKD